MQFKRGSLLRMLATALGSAVLSSRESFAAQAASVESDDREKVTGIGGLFFRARDPESLAAWYQQHLGILPPPASYGGPVWKQEAGPTAFVPFPQSTKYFGDPHVGWMANYRVRNLEKMVGQLRASGIAVTVDPQHYPNGQFARLHDPEGNPIELWQPVES